MKISACVIVKNESMNLPKWLECMKRIADEMIVVDTGSADQTIPIAEAAGAVVYKFEWCNDFSAAKNFALSKAIGDWVLFLDADEYFSEASIAVLREYLHQMHANKRIDAFFCRLINIDAGEHNRFISAADSLRIFRNSRMLHFIGSVHEHLVREGGPLRVSKIKNIEIYHTGYSGAIVRKKLERNLLLLQENIAADGERPWHYAYLADCYFGLGDYVKAVEYAKKSIESDVVLLGQESKIYRRLVDAAVLAEMTEEDIMCFIDDAIKKFPEFPEFLWSKGELFFRQKRYIDAELWIRQAVELYHKQRETNAGEDFFGKITLVYCTLGKLAVLKDDISSAMDYYAEALRCYKYNLFALQDLYGILRKQDPVDVIAFLRSLYDESEQDLKFILAALRKYKIDKVTLYYQQILKNKYRLEEMDFSVAGFLAVNKYHQAVEYAMEEIQNACEFLLVCGIKSKNMQNQQVIQSVLPFGYKMVFIRFLDEVDKKEQKEYDKDLYDRIEKMFLNK